MSQMKRVSKSSMEERKKYMKELMLQYHPDKNNAGHAKAVFQFVNAQKDWFMQGAS